MVAYRIGDTTWACATPRWSAYKRFSVHADAVTSAVAREVEISFAVATTLVMQLDDDGRIASAEVSSRRSCTDVVGTVKA